MAAIAANQVSAYPTDGSGEFSPDARRPGTRLSRQLKLQSITSGDTATAAVLGFSKLYSCSNATLESSGAAILMSVNLVANTLYVGTGVTDDGLYLTVIGAPKITTQ